MWTDFFGVSGRQGEKTPATEKEPGEIVNYPYPVKKIKVDNTIDIAYIDEGKEDNEILLFIHGMGSGVPVWEKNIDELRQSFRCIALDLPGHGFSSKGDFPYTIRFYVDVLFAFIHKLSLSKITLVGHSLGGLIAITAGLKDPQIIERLVLASPAGIEPYTALEKQTLINSTAAVVATGNAFTKNRYNYQTGFLENQEQAGELASKMAFFKDDAANFGRMMLRSVEGMMLESVNHSLTSIRQPTLIMVGKEDKVSPFQFLRGERFADIVTLEAAKIPRCKLVIFPACGHFVQYQQPKSFNEELLAFLQLPQKT